MPRTFRLLLCLLAIFAARSALAVPDQALRSVPPPVPPAIAHLGYHLVQNWDFGVTVTSLEALRRDFFTRFVYDRGTLDHLAANGEWQRYRDDGNHEIKGGVLDLVARLKGGLRDGGIESGMLRSKWTGKYGYFECRMKVPRGRGLWPAFWLNPQDQRWPPEIDVVEIVNNGRDTTRNSFHNVHAGRPGDAGDIATRLDRWGSFRPEFDYADGFHTFAVLWTPDRVIHYVDDVPVAERRFLWRHADGSDAGPAHILLNLAVGGAWPEAPTSAAEFPATLQVEYIRVWQK
ncbi:MAG TPA: glycoside hydrolase family 16 protein [Stellaceae bacterium]|nr:glycoside hydrolase family 16 protein [Stellaceae bacterium]